MEVYDEHGNKDALTDSFTAKCVAMMNTGIKVNLDVKKIEFVKAGRHYITSNTYSNAVKLLILEEAIKQCKADMQCTQHVSFLLSKPAWDWI